jgi:hypothetical protein
VHGISPKRGIKVTVEGVPGVWTVLEQSPERGSWWVQAHDDAAREHKWAIEARSTDMRRPAA